MKIINPLIIVLVLIALAYFGVKAGLTALFGVVIPYIAILIFVIGFIYRVINWAKSPVPFRIPPGVNLIPINPKTGMRTHGGADALLEAFKPGEQPPDEINVIGVGSGNSYWALPEPGGLY